MEFILTNYLDKYLETSKNSWKNRKERREVVKFFNNIIEGCSRGGRSSQKTAKEAITCILRYHDVMRESNNGVCYMGKYHNILYIGLKISYDWQIKDSGTIGTLLEQIYSCEKTFEKLFLGAMLGIRVPYFVAGWKSDYNDAEENLRAAVFFLDHACTAGLEFESEKGALMRMVDVPSESCGYTTPLMMSVQLGLADKVHIFLRFGALLRAAEEDKQNVSVVQNIILKLTEFNHKYPFNMVVIMQLILRVVPSLIPHLNGMFSYLGEAQRKTLLKKFNILVKDGIIPPTRSGIFAPELKHLCRCEIRKILWYNHQLPSGIHELQIPASLKKYLDIMSD